MTMEGSGVMPVYDLNNRTAAADGAGFGGGWMWVVMLFFLLVWGGGGFGGFGGGANGAVNTLTNEFLYTNLNSTLDRGFNQLANQNFGIQKDLCQGFGGVQAAIAQSTFAAQQCCCETNRNIDAVRYENAKNTCDITSAIHAEGEATRALMTANVMQELLSCNLELWLRLLTSLMRYVRSRNRLTSLAARINLQPVFMAVAVVAPCNSA